MTPIDFKILGPLEVHDGERQLALAGARQRALLAVLLLHANEVVSSDRLIIDLWGEQAPETASKALQVNVSRLRKLLEPRRGDGEPNLIIATRSPGYVLQVEPEQLDLARFERLCEQAREALGAGEASVARTQLGDALSLWRGEALADVAHEAFAQTEIARLEELRLAAVTDRLEADLQLGRHADLIGELEALIAEHPLAERLRAQLMLALYRSGRQAEALEAYQDARSALTGELGIEPGRDLRELQQAILRQDPGLDPGPIAEAATERPRGVFVGRERELARLVGALDDALAGRGRLVLMSGEPGIGKSRLADQLMGQARGRGASVLVGRCWEAGGAPAYWPWVQSLRTYVGDAEPEALLAQLGAGAGDLAQLLPELRERFPDLPEPPIPQSGGARFRMFDALSAFLRNVTRARPLVLVLDDLHAADEPSLLLLRFVARQIGDIRLLVVCAFRDVDPTMRDPLISALAELMREPQTIQLALGGLSEPDVADYVRLSTGSEAPAGLVQAIHAETEGNPLFATEVVRLLDAEGRIGEADTHLRIPPGVRTVIGQRLERLSERCRSFLVPASVLGREFGLDVLARLNDQPRDALLDALDEAISERVVIDVPGSPGRLRFGHALIRDTLYDEIPTARRLQLHQDAGNALEAVHSTDLDAHLADLAHHFFATGSAGSADKAVTYSRRAGDQAASQLAYEEAARLYEMGLARVDETVARCELLLALGEARARAGDTPAAKRAFREAAELAEAHDLAEHLGRAALGYGGRIIWAVSRDDDDFEPLLQRGLAALGGEDSPLRVRLLSRLAGGPLRDARHPPGRRAALSQEALDMARRLDDPATLAYALHGYILARHAPDHTPQQLALATELVQVAAEAGDKERVLEGGDERLDALIELGDMREAKAELEAMARLAEELRQPAQDWLVSAYRPLFALIEGRLIEAERLMADARHLGERAQSWNADVTYRLQLYMLRGAQGRTAELEDLIRQSVQDYPTYPIWRCVQAHMTAELGYADEARAALESLAVDEFGPVPFDEGWLVGLTLLAEVAHALDDAATATVLLRLLVPYGDRVAIAYPEVCTGSVARALGLLAATSGRWDEAGRHFDDALIVNERIGARPWLAHTQQDYAAMLLRRATPGDRERALELLAAALATYRELGMDSWAARVALQRSAATGSAASRPKP